VEYFRRDEGFFVLGSYMSGNNAAEARCRETQPVVMCYSPDVSRSRAATMRGLPGVVCMMRLERACGL
jgi:hypothetical protein